MIEPHQSSVPKRGVECAWSARTLRRGVGVATAISCPSIRKGTVWERRQPAVSRSAVGRDGRRVRRSHVTSAASKERRVSAREEPRPPNDHVLLTTRCMRMPRGGSVRHGLHRATVPSEKGFLSVVPTSPSGSRVTCSCATAGQDGARRSGRPRPCPPPRPTTPGHGPRHTKTQSISRPAPREV